MADTMTFEQFRAEVAKELDLDPAVLAEHVDLRVGLGLDSLQMYLLLVAVEDLGVWFPEDLLRHIVTMGDAYHHYASASGHRP